MNPPILLSVHFQPSGLNHAVSELLQSSPLVSAAGMFQSVPRVFRAFSEATPDVPAETPASVRLSTAWHRSQLLYRRIKEKKTLTHRIVHGLQKETHMSNNEPGSDVRTPGIDRDISTELARPLWGLRFDVLNLGAFLIFPSESLVRLHSRRAITLFFLDSGSCPSLIE